MVARRPSSGLQIVQNAALNQHRPVSDVFFGHGAQSCSWVGLTHGLGWVGLGRFFSIFHGLGWVGSNVEFPKILVQTYNTCKNLVLTPF